MANSNNMVQTTVPFFDGTEYDRWCSKMEVFLECHDLLDVVTKDMLRKEEGNTSSLNPSEDLEVENTNDSIEVSEVRIDVVERSSNFHEPEKEEKATELRAVLRKKDRKALYFIHQAISNSVFETIANAETAAEGWHAIKDQYKPSELQEELEQSAVARERARVPYPIPFVANDRGKYVSYCAAMFHAAVDGDWKTAEELIRKFPDIVRTRINSWENTALQIAVIKKQKYFVQKLVENMEEDDLLLQSKTLITALEIAAADGHTEIAKVLVDKNPRALLIGAARSRTPLQLAASNGHRKMVLYLYGVTDLKALSREQRINVFFHLIISGIYDKALDMLRADKSLAFRWHFESTPLHLLARKPSAISRESQLGFFKGLIRSRCEGIFHEAWMRTLARRLVEELWKTIIESQYYGMQFLEREHTRLLFDAAAIGNVEFILILFRSYPGVISQRGCDLRSVFHVAAVNRQENVFNLLYELGSYKTFVASNIEYTTGNTMLHLVARLAPPKRLQVVSGPALQLQRELLWFEAVLNITPPHVVERKNREGELAHEIFTKHHKELQKEGERWMKDTASSCMLVATLVATVAFASAFTAPGGNDQNTGIPILKTNRWFNIFVISDAVALCTSLLSGVFCLSILTSRYAESDFRRSLPIKLTVGLLVLAISITTMLLAFSASLFLIYSTEDSWIPIFTISLASGTSFLYGLLHWRLLFDTIKATFYSSILFKPWRRRIYHRGLPFPFSWVC